MGWKTCSACGRHYNDKLGGCANSACAQYDKACGSGAVQSKPVTPPVFSASPLVTHTVSSTVPRTSDAPSLAPVNPLPAVKGTPLLAERFTLVCYRGEKSAWWPAPQMRLAAGGMRVFEPWPGKTVADIWAKLVEEVKCQPGSTVKKKVQAFAQHLRAEGRPFALASARTRGGAFEGYSYVIEIPNARTFRWADDYTLGTPANFTNTAKTTYQRMINQNLETFTRDTIDADYIVLNADSIADSTILGFGHLTGTYEVTFLHDVPQSFITSVNGEPLSSLQIHTKEALQKLPDTDQKRTALKLFRGD